MGPSNFSTRPCTSLSHKSKHSKSLSKGWLIKADACDFSGTLSKDKVELHDAATKLAGHVVKKTKAKWLCTAAQTEHTIKLFSTTKLTEPRSTVALRARKPEQLDDPDLLARKEKWKCEIGQMSKTGGTDAQTGELDAREHVYNRESKQGTHEDTPTSRYKHVEAEFSPKTAKYSSSPGRRCRKENLSTPSSLEVLT